MYVYSYMHNKKQTYVIWNALPVHSMHNMLLTSIIVYRYVAFLLVAFIRHCA
jgi:hypothetical protein